MNKWIIKRKISSCCKIIPVAKLGNKFAYVTQDCAQIYNPIGPLFSF